MVNSLVGAECWGSLGYRNQKLPSKVNYVFLNCTVKTRKGRKREGFTLELLALKVTVCSQVKYSRMSVYRTCIHIHICMGGLGIQTVDVRQKNS